MKKKAQQDDTIKRAAVKTHRKKWRKWKNGCLLQCPNRSIHRSDVFVCPHLSFLQHTIWCDRPMDVAPQIPARFSGSPSDSACADTLLTDVLPKAVVQWCHSMGPVYQPVPHPSPNLISHQHFRQVTACDRCTHIVKDSIYL